jgi:hypothetical protein
MPVKSNLDVKIHATETRADDLGGAKKIHALNVNENLADGLEANQSDLVWSDRRSVTYPTADVLNLRELVGNTLQQNTAFHTVTILAIKNLSEVGAIVVGDDTFDSPFGGGANTIGPGGVLLLSNPKDGFTVPTTPANLKIAASEGTISYDLLLVGRSAETVTP